jgi:hypothetical protein
VARAARARGGEMRRTELAELAGPDNTAGLRTAVFVGPSPLDRGARAEHSRTTTQTHTTPGHAGPSSDDDQDGYRHQIHQNNRGPAGNNPSVSVAPYSMHAYLSRTATTQLLQPPPGTCVWSRLESGAAPSLLRSGCPSRVA